MAEELLLEDATIDLGGLARRPALTPEVMERSLDAFSLFERAVQGGSFGAKAKLLERMTTSDYPILLNVAFGTKLLDAYENIAPIWQGFASREVVPDFLPQTWVDIFGGQGDLPLVAENAPYTADKVQEGTGSYQVKKYGKTFPLTWEMFINDRLGAFLTLPNRLAVAARDKEDRLATLMLTNGSGPNTNLFSSSAAKGKAGAAVTTILTGNKALTEANLGLALDQIGTRVDYDGRPVVIKAAVLVVPPQLRSVAMRIVGASVIRETIGSSTVERPNPYAGMVEVVVDPWLNALDAGANKATNWFVLPDPKTTPKPAIVVAFLAGHEDPDLRVKNDQGNRVGGGPIAPEEGSFEFDAVEYRVRHVVGTGTVDATAVGYSDGSG